MSEEDILDKLDELSDIVEGGEEESEVKEQLKLIEELTATTPEEKEEEPREEKREEKVAESKPEKTVEKKPEKIMRKSPFYRIAAISLLVIGVAIYALAFYLRLEGWRLIRNPPSALVAVIGTLIILGGGEMYYRDKMGK